MKKNSVFNFAILGCGSVSLDHANAIRKLGHKIIFGSTKKKNSKNWNYFKLKYPDVKYDSIENILNNKNVDFIISCLPLNVHKKYCKQLLCSNKPILIEKPLHDNYEILKKILINKKVKTFNKVVGYNRRSYFVVDKLKKKIIKTNLKSVNVNISENFTSIKKKFKSDAKSKFLYTGSSSHIIDLLYYLLGELKIIKKWKLEKKDNLSFCLVLANKNNIPINININPSDPFNPKIDFRFKDETLWQLSPIEELSIFKSNYIKNTKKNFFKREYKPNLLSNLKENIKDRPGFINQMEKFIKKDYKNLCNVRENLSLIKILNQIMR